MVTRGKFVLAMAIVGGPSFAQDSPAPLGCPTAGTVIKTTIAEARFSGPKGIYCNFTVSTTGSAESRDVSRAYLLFFDSPGSQRYRENFAALWPMSVGKSIEYEFQEGRDQWQNKISVVRTEKITVPAGTFDAYVIDWNIDGSNSHKSVQTFWYAPAVSYFVKYDVDVKSGWFRPPRQPWEAVSITKP